MLRRILVATPTTMLIAAVPLSKVNAKTDGSEDCTFMCKRSDLPLYRPFNTSRDTNSHGGAQRNGPIRDGIESGVRTVRIEVQKGYGVVQEQINSLDEYFQTAKAHTQSTIDYLNEPQNTLPRSGAIAIGGLSGFIFATRGGFIKKVLYTTIGAGALASICYPRQAEHYAQDALVEARKAYAILYNFTMGVKPGDEKPPELVSNFPTTVGDVKHFFYDLYDEAKEAVFGKRK